MNRSKRIKILFFLVLLKFFSFKALAGITIVVLGSSTAEGLGPKNINNTWVNRYTTYIQSFDPSNNIINLAKGGYTTYNIMPTGYTPKNNNGYLMPDPERNITKALSYNPNAIIINMPTNDVSYGISTVEQMSNYKVIVALATKANVPVWISTSQPRNYDISGRDSLILMKNKIIDIYKEKAINFWTKIANNDGTINVLYDYGDGIHLNDLAHEVLFQKVVDAEIFYKKASEVDTNNILNRMVSLITVGNILKVSFETEQIVDLTLNIYTELGQLVYFKKSKSELGSNIMETNFSKNGIYIAKVSIGNASTIIKFAK